MQPCRIFSTLSRLGRRSGTPIRRDHARSISEVPECARTRDGRAVAGDGGMSSRPLLYMIVALAGACAESPELSSTEQLASSRVAYRGVLPTANQITDWTTSKLLDPALVASGNLKVRYCEEHFPPGSQVLANLEKALNAYSSVPGVSIDITDIAPEPGTSTHPDLATFAFPADTIYVDYSEMDAYAFASRFSCDNGTPNLCSKAKIMITDTAPGFSNPMVVDDATSVGVFMHELGHVFNMKHINEQDDSLVLLDPSGMGLDRATVHGLKTHATDFRSNLIHAATLGMLRTYYSEVDSYLDTNEIVAHHNMSIVDGDTHIEWNPAKTYRWGTARSAIAELNETKMRWNSSSNTFEPCDFYGTLPRWFARMSDTSTNQTNTPFESVFEVSRNIVGTVWTEVATHTFDSDGNNDLRQIEWEKTFRISLADIGLTSAPNTVVDRKLRFRADAGNDLAERVESNNQWWVNVCFYPENDTTCSRECLQPSSPSNGGDNDDDDHD
jgi:hypothetical protein